MTLKTFQITPRFLATQCSLIDFENPPFKLDGFVDNFKNTMKELGGVGLAANQVGFPYQIICLDMGEPFVMFNPKILEKSEETNLDIEGCLSFPGLFVKIKRANYVKVWYQNINGVALESPFTGLSARIVQHEIDHLKGITFIDRATRYHLEMAKRQRKRDLRHANG